jgi:hypothetical protein
MRQLSRAYREAFGAGPELDLAGWAFDASVTRLDLRRDRHRRRHRFVDPRRCRDH